MGGSATVRYIQCKHPPLERRSSDGYIQYIYGDRVQHTPLEADHLVQIYLSKINDYVRSYVHGELSKIEYQKKIVTIYYDVINTCKDEKTLAAFVEDEWVKISLKGAL